MRQPSAAGAIDPSALAEQLLAQAAEQHAQRAAGSLPHPVDGLRHTMIALRAGAQLQEHNSPPGPAVLLVLLGLFGHARLVAGGPGPVPRQWDGTPLGPNES